MCLWGIGNRNFSVLVSLQCNHLSVPGWFASKAHLSSGYFAGKTVRPKGVLHAEVSVPGGLQAISVCPGVLSGETCLFRGLQAKSICPRAEQQRV